MNNLSMTVDNITFAPLNRAYQQHQDKLILLIMVLLSLYLIAFLAEVTWRLLDNSQEQSTQKISSPSNGVSQQSNTRVDIDAIKRLNLFGDAEAVAVSQATEQDVTDAPETKLNLTLTGVVSSSNPSLGAAIIERNNTQVTYGVGEKIEGTNATLDKIYVDRVIIKNRLIKETLMLDGIDYDEANRNKQQTVNRPQNNIAGPTRVTASNNIQNMRKSIASSPTSFADFISIKPHAPQGELTGYRVSPGKQADFFKEVGLRSGDIITEINGLDLSDIQQSLEAIEVLKEAQSLQMEIIRSGENISLEIDMPSSDAS